MNKTRLRPNQHAVETELEQPFTSPHAHSTGHGNEAVRDFFRRGDRGQYEGGPADQAFDSLPSWDLPERATIVRTPKQRARRIAMMWAEAGLMLGCVAFLATAALKASSNSSPRFATDSIERSARQAAAQSVTPDQTPSTEATKPSAPLQAAARKVTAQTLSATAINPVTVSLTQPPSATRPSALSNPDAPSNALAPSAQTASRAPTVTDSALVHSAATSAATQDHRKVTTAATKPHLESLRTKNSRSTYSAPISNRGEATPASSPIATKRAVAAFPDD